MLGTRTLSLKFLLGILVLLAFASAQAASFGSGITYTGRIVKDENPVESGTVRFFIWIQTQGGCDLYAEQRDVDMTGSAGTYSFEIGTGAMASSFPHNAFGVKNLADVFDNTKKTSDLDTSRTGCLTFTPNADEGRVMKVQFIPPGEVVAQALPDLVLTAVPTAQVAFNANKVNGYGTGDLLKVDPSYTAKTTPNNPLSAAQYEEFWKLILGTSTTYLKAIPTLGGDVTGTLPAMTVVKIQNVAVAAPTTGDTGKILTYNGTGMVWSAASAGGITSLNGQTVATQSFAVGNTGTDFNISSSGGTHTFNIPNASSSNRGLVTSSDWNTFNSKQSSSLGAGQVWIGNASGAAQAQTLSGDVTVNNAGVTSLKTVGTAGTYFKVVTDDQGRVTSGSVLASGDVTTALGYTPASANAGYVNGGNSFSGNASIGLNDAYNLDIKTAGTTRMTIAGNGNVSVTGTNANTFAVGQNGATNPALQIDTSVASSVTGLQIKSNTSGGSIDLNAISSASDATVSINTKGNGWLNLGGGGAINLSQGLGSVNFGMNSGTSSFWRSTSTDNTTVPVFQITGGNGGSVPNGGVEATSILFDLASTRVHQGNTNIPTQRDFRVKAMTHGFANSGGTITNAATFSVDGPVLGGTNATLTSSSAIYVPASAVTNVTNSYGLIVNATTGATNNYAASFMGGNVGIGTASPAYTLDMATATDAVRLPRGTDAQRPANAAGLLRYSTTSNLIEYNNGSGWSALSTGSGSGYVNGGNTFGGNATIGLNDAYTLGFKTNNATQMTLDSSGKLGIGTAAPISKLQVHSTANADNAVSVSVSGAGSSERAKIDLVTLSDGNALGSTSNNRGWAMTAYGNSYGTSDSNDLDFSYWGSAAWTQGLRLTQSGKVGIGTSDPQYSLDFNSRTDAIRLPAGTTAQQPTAAAGLIRYNTSTNFVEYNNGSAWVTVGSPSGSTLGAGQMWVGNASGVAQAFSLSGDVSSVSSSGAVVVNKTTTGASSTILSLDGSGVANAYGFGVKGATSGTVTLQAATTTANYSLKLPATSPAANQILQSDAAGQMSWVTNNASSGYVNGGNSFTGNATIGLNDAYTLGFKTNNATQMTLDASGKLGIGTATPTAALDVNGAINISGMNGMSYPSTDSTAGSSIAIGSGALVQQSSLASAAYRNTAVGYQAMNNSGLTSTATRNTAFGYQAGNGITTGYRNTFVGYAAGTGSGPTRTSTAIGYNAAINAGSSGYDVVLVGANTSCCGGGTGGTVVGSSSVGSNNGGIAIGNVVNQWGDASISIGSNSATGDYYTVVIGGSAKSSSSSGIALGASTGSINVTGVNNVLIGSGVGSTTLTTGARNLLIGVDNSTDAASATTSNSMNIGNALFATNMKNATNTTGVAKIGINNNSPSVTLDIGSATDAIRLPAGNTSQRPSNAAGLFRYNTTNSNVEFNTGSGWSTLASTSGATGAYVNGGNSFTGNATIGLNDSYALGFKTNGATQMTIDSSGRVGIGTTSPVANLDVVGSAAFENNANSTAAANFSFWKSRNYGVVQQNDNLGFFSYYGSDGSNQRRAAYISSTVDNTVATNSVPGNLVFATTQAGGTDSTERMRIASNGNVGIGTNSPGFTLEVASSVVDFNNANMQVTNTATTNTWTPIIAAAAPNAVDGAAIQVVYGVGPTNGNRVEEGFIYHGDGNADNAYSLGFYGKNDLITVLYGGNIGLGTASPVGGVQIGENAPSANPRQLFLGEAKISGTQRPQIVGQWNSGGAWGMGPSTTANNDYRVKIGYVDGTNSDWDTSQKISLDVDGPVVSTPQSVTGATVNLAASNTITISAIGSSTITLQNMVHGGNYTLLVSDTTSRTYTFSGCNTSKFKPANTATVSGTSTMYNIITVYNGSTYDCWITWASGYQ